MTALHRLWQWLARWAEAVEASESEHLEQRVRVLEQDIAALRAAAITPPQKTGSPGA